jgi:hypothetical protein
MTLIGDIRNELDRLNLHPVNLSVHLVAADLVQLGGSLLPFWNIPDSVNGMWLLSVLKGLPDAAGGKATMEAVFAAHAQRTKPAE